MMGNKYKFVLITLRIYKMLQCIMLSKEAIHPLTHIINVVVCKYICIDNGDSFSSWYKSN